MAVNAVIGTNTLAQPDETVASPHHSPVFESQKVAAGQGVVEAGAIMALNSSDELVAYGSTTSNLGAGDGTVKDFSGTLGGAPLAPGSVTVTDGTQTLQDDGHGSLYGDGSGTVNYVTGEVSVTFAAAPASTASVDALAANQPVAVITERCDTAKEDSAVVLVHGSVWRGRINVGGSAVSEADINRLRDIGIFVVS